MEFKTTNGTEITWLENKLNELCVTTWQGYSPERGETQSIKRVFFRVDVKENTVRAVQAEIKYGLSPWQSVIQAAYILSDTMKRAVRKAVALKYGKAYFRLV